MFKIGARPSDDLQVVTRFDGGEESEAGVAFTEVAAEVAEDEVLHGHGQVADDDSDGSGDELRPQPAPAKR